MIRLALAFWVLIAAPAFATQDGWPALHDVTGVASDDVLNIRAPPYASSPVVGQLAPDATVEVIRPNDRQTWGLVNAGEGTGWVSLRYMQRRPGQWDGAFPEIAACFGTEPFWRLRRDGEAITFSTPEHEASYAVTARSGSENRRDSFHMIAEGADGSAVAILQTEACADGMSDRAFGISVQLLIGLGRDARQLSGCCSLAA